MSTLGIIAGNGRLPFLVAKEARLAGRRIHICAIEGETDRSIQKEADIVDWIRLGQIKKLVQFFHRENTAEAIMAGKITKTNLFKGHVWPDADMIKLIAGSRDAKDDTLLGMIADYLDRHGVKILSSVAFLGNLLPSAGILSQKKPSAGDLEEIDFSWKIAKTIAELDIGQTVVTKKKAILAVEAIEGTDEAIRRGAALGSGAITVVKVAKPQQDMRFDVPAIGLRTLNAMIQAKVKILALEAGKTILMDRDQFIKKVNRCRMIVVARPHDE